MNFDPSGLLPPTKEKHPYPLSNMTQQSSPSVLLLVAGDGSPHPIQKSADGAFLIIASRVHV